MIQEKSSHRFYLLGLWPPKKLLKALVSPEKRPPFCWAEASDTASVSVANRRRFLILQQTNCYKLLGDKRWCSRVFTTKNDFYLRLVTGLAWAWLRLTRSMPTTARRGLGCLGWAETGNLKVRLAWTQASAPPGDCDGKIWMEVTS